MENEHNIDALRLLLKALHDKIGALESRVVTIGPRRSANLRKRIEESRRQEAAILAKLSKAGVSLDI